MANINKISLAGTIYDIQDQHASKSVELTQSAYDGLSVKDPNTFYIITDAQGGDLSNYYTKGETDTLLGGLKLVKLTQSEYSAMEQAGTLDNSTLYIVIGS